MKKYQLQDYTFLIGVASVVLILDQLSKSIVRTTLSISEIWSPWHWLVPYARIVHWQNTGAAFGIFQNFGVVFSILAVIVSIAIIYYFPQVPKDEWLIRLALGMQLGGAIGNLIDRMLYNWAVTDFISVGNFAVFNVADASVSVGTLLLVIGMWQREKKQEAERAAASSGADLTGDPPSNIPEDIPRE